MNKYAEELKIGTEHYNFGGFYKVGNYFYNNNIAYLYMERILDKSETYSLSYDGETSLDLAFGTYQLSYTALKNGTIVEDPRLLAKLSLILLLLVEGQPSQGTLI